MSAHEMPEVVRRWHALVAAPDRAVLHGMLAENAVFRSPAVHAPQEGRDATFGYLGAALAVLGPTLTYHREFYAEDGAVLEFTATLGDREVHGIDLIHWDGDGLIDDFTVMVRPLRGLERLIELMREELTRA